MYRTHSDSIFAKTLVKCKLECKQIFNLFYKPCITVQLFNQLIYQNILIDVFCQVKIQNNKFMGNKQIEIFLFIVIAFSFLTIYGLQIQKPQQPKLPFHILEVFGNTSFGYYYVDLHFGSPPQKQSVIIDTGSSMLTVPCTKCSACSKNHIDQYFDLAKSKSYKFLTCGSQSPLCIKSCTGDVDSTQQCRFTVSYAEGSSLQGIYLQDVVQFEPSSKGQQVRIDFGCTTRQTNLFLKQEANGIFGLAPQRTQILQKIFNRHSPKTHQKLQIGLCLRKNGGYMSVGGAKDSFHRKPAIKTTFTQGSNLYTISNVGNVKLGQKVFHNQGQKTGLYGIFIDSGSTFTYFPTKQFDVFIALMDSRCKESGKCSITIAKSSSSKCYKLLPDTDLSPSVSQLQKIVQQIFPSIFMQVNGSNLEWVSTQYMLMRDVNHREVCSGIQKLDRFLLGSNWMVNKDIVLNIKQKTVEIYPDSHCFIQQESLKKQHPIQRPIVKQQSLTTVPATDIEKHEGHQQGMKMGQYLPKITGNTPLSTLDSTKTIDSSPWIIISIVSLVIIIISAVILIICLCFNKNKKGVKLGQIQQDQSAINPTPKKSLLEKIASQQRKQIQDARMKKIVDQEHQQNEVSQQQNLHIVEKQINQQKNNQDFLPVPDIADQDL